MQQQTSLATALDVAAERRDRSMDAPVHPAGHWREHDLLIRRFHLAGLIPAEIAVVLNSKGLTVKTWAVTETFVRNRLKALKLAPNHSQVVFSQGRNVYLERRRAAGDTA